ncbi:MAG: molybdopterin-binding protein, partial [Acidobacteriota bacterium]
MAAPERPARLGILSISDRASRGEYEDRSGPAIRAYLDEVIISPKEHHFRLIPDEQKLIESTLIELADTVGCDLVITSGGTGPAPRDV